MFIVKINDQIGFYLNCRCNVSEICASKWYLENERFPNNFDELYHNNKFPLFNTSIEIDNCAKYLVYKDPYIRTVDNYALLTTGKWCKELQKAMKDLYGFSKKSSFAKFLDLVKKELQKPVQENHFEPISNVLKEYSVDYFNNNRR